MTPADSKDWWLAAAALSSAVSSTALAADVPQAGVVTAAIASTRNAAGASNGTSVVLGDQVHPGERFVTGPQGLTHILFLDQSSVTLGPDTSLTLDAFSHDSATKTGKIAMTLEQGTVRVVGGLNSKANPTEIKTASALVSIQGGITMVEHEGGKTSGVFLFGERMRMTAPSGNTETVTRAGFGVTADLNGLSDPQRAPTNDLNQMLSRLEAPSGNGNTQPSGAPPGQLLSTQDRPAGGESPSASLSPDRLSDSSSPLVGPAMSNNRPDSITPNNPSNTTLTLQALLGANQPQNQS
ncbi:MAG TPA: FecR domain-containing protein [Alphaproteobacteria bacterium]|jgi:hypothetical protein